MTDPNISDKLSVSYEILIRFSSQKFMICLLYVFLQKERQLALELLNTKGSRSSPRQYNKQGSTSSHNFNISACYADRTQEVQLTPSKNENNNDDAGYNFEPKEISGRSTDFTGEIQPLAGSFQLRHFVTPGLDEIFATSICDDVREVGRSMSQLSSARNSLQSMPRTADIDLSPASVSGSSVEWNQRGYNKDWLADAVNAPQVNFDDEFESAGDKNVRKLLFGIATKVFL